MTLRSASNLRQRPRRPLRRRYLRATFIAAVVTIGLLPDPAVATPPSINADTAYQRFCDNNSDLCTVTERVLNIDHTTTYVLKCTLDVGDNHCPPSGVVIDGPYYRQS